MIINTIIGITIENIFHISNTFTIIYDYFILAQWILFLILCIVRIVDISNYNEPNKTKNGKKKFKFKPVLYNIEDVKKWIYYSKEPDIIYVESKNKNIITIVKNNDTKRYFYKKNIFGDIVEIVDSNNLLVAKYLYDAWGNCEITLNVNNIANINPFRYRGYYYDVEIGLYLR